MILYTISFLSDSDIKKSAGIGDPDLILIFYENTPNVSDKSKAIVLANITGKTEDTVIQNM